MSIEGDDDTELRDLVATTLQSSGILGKIKAQLRSNVYLAIEGDEDLKKKSKHVNRKLDKFASTTDGRLALQLIREFMTFFGLDFSLMVYEPEALEGRNISLRNREKLIENLGFAETLNAEAPLLSEIIKLSKVSVLKSETPTPTSESSNKFLFRNEDDLASLQSDKSTLSNFEKNNQSLTPENSFNANNNTTTKIDKSPSLQQSDKELNATYTMTASEKSKIEEVEQQKKEDFKPSNLSFLGDLPPLGGGSVGKNLPPVGTGGKNLAPLKKIPLPVAKVEAQKPQQQPKEEKPKPALEVKPNMTLTKPQHKVPEPSQQQPASLSLDEDIDEEIDDFLNSSISASEELTKEDTVTEEASLRADYTEKLT